MPSISCLFFIWLCRTACGIVVPLPGIEPRVPAAKALSPHHWPSRVIPAQCLCSNLFLLLCICSFLLHVPQGSKTPSVKREVTDHSACSGDSSAWKPLAGTTFSRCAPQQHHLITQLVRVRVHIPVSPPLHGGHLSISFHTEGIMV